MPPFRKFRDDLSKIQGWGNLSLYIIKKGTVMSLFTLYTLGYSGHQHEDVIKAIKAMGALLVDIRFAPYSRWQPIWNKKALEGALGADYVHLRALGNENYKGEGGIVLHQPAEGVGYVVNRLRERDVILLCACKEVGTCHRQDASALVAEACGCAVVHLDKAMVQALACGGDVGDATHPPKQLGLWW